MDRCLHGSELWKRIVGRGDTWKRGSAESLSAQKKAYIDREGEAQEEDSSGKR